MAFRDWRGFDIADVLSLQSRVDRNRFIPFLLQPSLSASYRAHLRRYAELVSHLYTAIANAAGADVVVDSSKHPSTAFLLRHVGVDLRVVHLVRDAHGVAFSWAKKVYRPEATPGHELMATATPVRSASRWMTYNLLFHLLASTGTPVLLVRYETLVRSPRQELSRILALVDVRPPDHVMQFVRPGAVSLRPNHTVSGNPLRFLQGSVALRPDDAWKERMRWEQRAVTTALTWPLLARYGYRQWRTADGG
jgi:hypothetical protein